RDQSRAAGRADLRLRVSRRLRPLHQHRAVRDVRGRDLLVGDRRSRLRLLITSPRRFRRKRSRNPRQRDSGEWIAQGDGDWPNPRGRSVCGSRGILESAMTDQAKWISADEFWKIAHLPENTDKHMELMGGVIYETPLFGFEHGVVAGNMCGLVGMYVRAYRL